MAHWSLADIPWHEFDAGKVNPELVSLAKAACLVEYNGDDYARYLREVFADNPALHATIENWAQEEVRHGMALRQWAELADPAFDFDKSFSVFTTGYQLPLYVAASVRGSRSGEMIARCVVEAGTSNYYTAIKEYTDEPVLKAICAKIAADEFRHYKLFYDIFREYQDKEKINLWTRLSIAVGRVAESEDDELAYAFFAAHDRTNQRPYDRKANTRRCLAYMGKLYRKKHIENMTAMIFKAVGLKPHTLIHKISSTLAWNILQLRTRSGVAYAHH